MELKGMKAVVTGGALDGCGEKWHNVSKSLRRG